MLFTELAFFKVKRKSFIRLDLNQLNWVKPTKSSFSLSLSLSSGNLTVTQKEEFTAQKAAHVVSRPHDAFAGFKG